MVDSIILTLTLGGRLARDGRGTQVHNEREQACWKQDLGNQSLGVPRTLTLARALARTLTLTGSSARPARARLLHKTRTLDYWPLLRTWEEPLGCPRGAPG